MPLLSLCMIVKNEATHLARALKSARETVDEMVVVDMGSDDGTVAIAESLGARVLYHAWADDFSAARNISLEAASGNWALVLDADEVLVGPKGEAFRQRLQDTDAAGFRVIVRNFFDVEEQSGFEDALLTRLFRLAPDIRYERSIHEQILPAIRRAGGRIEDSDTLIRHHGYASDTVQGGNCRTARNLKMLREALVGEPDQAYLHFQLGVTLNAASEFAEANAALLKAVELPGLGRDARVRADALLGQMALREKRVPLAFRYASAALADDPLNACALFVAAYSAMALGELEEALPLIERALAHPALPLARRPMFTKMRALCLSTKKSL